MLVFSGQALVRSPRDLSGNPFGFIDHNTLHALSSTTFAKVVSEFTGWSDVSVSSKFDTDWFTVSDPTDSHVDLNVYNADYQPVHLEVASLFEGTMFSSPFLGFAAAIESKPFLEFSEGDVVSWNGTMFVEEDMEILPSKSSTFAGLDLEIQRLPADHFVCQYAQL